MWSKPLAAALAIAALVAFGSTVPAEAGQRMRTAGSVRFAERPLGSSNVAHRHMHAHNHRQASRGFDGFGAVSLDGFDFVGGAPEAAPIEVPVPVPIPALRPPALPDEHPTTETTPSGVFVLRGQPSHRFGG